jgi:hypothetical protein
LAANTRLKTAALFSEPSERCQPRSRMATIPRPARRWRWRIGRRVGHDPSAGVGRQPRSFVLAALAMLSECSHV